MKKLLLLVASSSIALTAGAQQKAGFMSQPDNEAQAMKETRLRATTSDLRAFMNHTANKGTAANRNVSYTHALDTSLQIAGAGTDITIMNLWKDTTAQIVYSSGTQNNVFVSAAEILDASAPILNNPDYYQGQMRITRTDAFNVKKLTFFGLYSFNPSKTSVKDTIRLSFVKGSAGAPASDDVFSGYSLAGGGHYGSVSFLDLHYDSVRNYATNAANMPGLTSPANMVVDVILDNSTSTPAWGDTLSNGLMMRTVTLPGAGLAVPANGYAAVSISFISGDATFPYTSPGTVVGDATTDVWTYNMFRPLVRYRTDGASTDPQWLDYTPWNAGPDSNANCGFFKRLPSYSNGWINTYVPMWAWSTGGGTTASALQHLELDWELECSLCGTIEYPVTSDVANVTNINTASAYPNPAVNEVTVPFTLNNSNDVTVTLTNVVGQVVATQSFKNVTTGTATFNTAALANGVYSYSVIAGGQRTTGRVAIAH